MLRLYKKYPNRRLYGPFTRLPNGDIVRADKGNKGQAMGYRTMVDLEMAIREGYTVEVIDHETHQDLTPVVLKQLVLEHVTWTSQQMHRMIVEAVHDGG
jgi:polyhydroxyalkanoate synthesis regulator protein